MLVYRSSSPHLFLLLAQYHTYLSLNYNNKQEEYGSLDSDGCQVASHIRHIKALKSNVRPLWHLVQCFLHGQTHLARVNIRCGIKDFGSCVLTRLIEQLPRGRVEHTA